MAKAPKTIFVEVSLVQNCPHCGGPFGETGRIETPQGVFVCHHPTRIRKTVKL